MTVNVTRDAINVREKLAELDKPTGIAGEAMLRAETPQEQQALIGVGRRNVLINGGFDVWQRATSVTGATSYGYSSADRWQHNASGGTLSISRQALTVGQTSVPRSLRYFMRLNATTGNNNAGIWQSVEGVDRVQGNITISFYAKGTNPSGGNFEIELEQYFGSGGSTYISSVETFSVTSEWQKFTLNINVPSISGKTISGGNDYYRVYFRQPENDGTTTAWTLDFTGVQLEVGKVATPFEHRSYGEELALCQRYYYQAGGENTSQFLATGQAYSTTQFNGCVIPFPVTMRDAPEMSYASASNFKVQNSAGSGITVTSLSISTGEESARSASVRGVVGSGLVAGNATMFYTANTSGILKFDAEL